MISSFRKLAKSPLALVILAPLVLGLAIVGFTDPFGGLAGGDSVVRAGDRRISQQDFRLLFDNQLEQARQQQPNLTQEQVVEQGGHIQMLESLRANEGFLAWAWKAGIRPGKALIIDQIRKVPAFFNQVTGQFDEAAYAQALAGENLTQAMFEADLRDSFAATHFNAGLYAGMRAPRVYGALVANSALEARDGRWFLVTQAMAGAAPAPTDQQLQAFLTENAERLRRPEFRGVSVVLFGPGPNDAAPAISDARIQERFNFRREALTQPETRTFVTLTARDQAGAQRMAQALRSGQSAEAVGQANDVEPVAYDARPRSAVADAAVAGAAFGLQSGQVSNPVQAGLGWTVIQLQSIQPGRAATLESTRDAIVQELQAEDVRARTYEMVEAYEAARTNGANLADAARQAGARIVNLPPFTEEGQLPDGQPLPGPPQLVSTAYSLEANGESDVIDAGEGQYFALRVNQITPAALPTIAEVREPLVQAWTQRENQRRLSAKADELSARVRNGEDIAAVARSAGAELIVRTGVQQNAQSQEQIGQGVLQGLFGQGRGQVFSGQASETSFAVGRVDAIRAPAAPLAAPIGEQIRPRLSVELVEELASAARAAAAEQTKATSNPNNARRALGLAPEEDTAPAAPQ